MRPPAGRCRRPFEIRLPRRLPRGKMRACASGFLLEAATVPDSMR